MCAVCERVWRGFVGSECVLCVGHFGVGLWGVSVCYVWDSLVWVCGSESVPCVGQFGVGLGE